MLSALRFWLSPSRRRFMRAAGQPAMAALCKRLCAHGSPRAIEFATTLLRANVDFLAYALSAQGPLAGYRANATPERVESCLGSALIYSVNLFARDEFRRDESELIPLLAAVLGTEPRSVMLKRDNLRKAPRSEEWMFYSWLVADLGGELPSYDADLERSFGYNYLSYMEQFRATLAAVAALPE